MKKLNIFTVLLCSVLVLANAISIFMLNSKIDSLNSKLSQLEVQLAGARNSMNSSNYIQGNAKATEKDVFTPTELSQYLGIELSKIYDMIDKADTELPYISIDAEYRFGKEAIDDWLKTNKDIFTGN